jgi:hypothetical protein
MRIYIFFIFILFFNICSYSQDYSISKDIQWSENLKLKNGSEKLSFKDAFYFDKSTLFPYYFEQLEVPFYCDVVISNPVFEKLDQNQFLKVQHIGQLPDTILLVKNIGISRGTVLFNLKILPVFQKKDSKDIFRLKSFVVNFHQSNTNKSAKSVHIASAHSVLQSGKWYKIKVKKDGIYKLTYAQLKKIGIANPGNIRVYGNGGGMLPKLTNISRPDDLTENSIYYSNGGNGSFSDADYILFYGQGPNIWKYYPKDKHFFHTQNKYSDYNYYFLTDNFGAGKQISTSDEPANGTTNVTTFIDYAYHEQDLINLINSGLEWYGDKTDSRTPIILNDFSFTNILTNSKVFLYYDLISRSSASSFFTINYLDTSYSTPIIGTINYGDVNENAFAQSQGGSYSFYPSSSNFNLKLTYNNTGDENGVGYVNYIYLNVRRALKYEGGQLFFRNIDSIGPGNSVNFLIDGATENLKIWDITNVTSPLDMKSNLSNSKLSFAAANEKLRQFVVFNSKSGLLNPIDNGDGTLVENQDIHGAANPDMIIVCPPDPGFINQANILANFRRSNDGLKVLVTTTEKVFNEFSSGTKDVTAIRDMVKMFYDRVQGINDKPKYLLLFGKGTFDNKSENENNKNLIPTYESKESLDQNGSYVTDDFFGWMADTLSDEYNWLDIGVGRFPVKDSVEAADVVNKTISYSSPSQFGDWRNTMCFIGDYGIHSQGDDILYSTDADKLAKKINALKPNFIVQKIYVDAYPMVETAVGDRFPDVNIAINNRVNNGALIVNYTGHANEQILSKAHIVDAPQILKWNNSDKLTIFITASCEFSRFDNVGIITPGEQFEVKTSAGEAVLLNPNGGGIALLTTTRLVYESDNSDLNQDFIDVFISKGSNGKYLKLGDAIYKAKNLLVGSSNRLNFTLLGDPSLLPAFPKNYGIITDTINGKPLKTGKDTLNALSKVRVSGHLEDESGNIVNAFNGIIYPTVFDKEIKRSTLGNNGSDTYTFISRENIIFKGTADVKKGRFSFEFPIPKDIQYNLDSGKIVYYANDSVTDYTGYTYNFIVGGLSTSFKDDNSGPEINLYMNDTNYIEGHITSPNPKLLVKLYDTSGINVTGVGIGHDITAVLDGDYSNLFSLNDYYKSDLNDYKRGSALYPLNNLTPGEHTIKVIAWDISNNSSEGEINFMVINNNKLVIKNVSNYPNPFTYQTNFIFEHNWADEPLDIEIRIYSMTGQLLNVLKSHEALPGFREPLLWDGTDSRGHFAGQGIYLYQVLIKGKNSNTAEGFGKMVVVRSK